MSIIPESYAPKATDPNAPKTLDLDLARKLAKAAPKYGRMPNGDVVSQMGEQLACALDRLEQGSTAVVTAQNDATRYQRESENANREVQTMMTQLAQVREERDALRVKVAALEGELTVLKTPPAPKKRGPKAKVVPINPQREAAQ